MDIEGQVVTQDGVITLRYFEGELLKPVVGETLEEKVKRHAEVIANCNS
jgi:hypothetical protein